MKTRSIITTLALLTLSPSWASAEIINADFQGKIFGIVGPNGDGTAYSGQGALADPGNDFWNGIALAGDGNDSYPSFTTPALADSENQTTMVTLTIGPSGGTYYHFNQSAFGAPDENWASGFGSLLGDYLDGGGGGSSVAINNLTPNGVYNVYLYGTTSGTGGSSFTIGGSTQTTTSLSSPHDLEEGVDYVIFSNAVANASGLITISYTGKFAGLQIENTLVVVPPPSQEVINADFQGKTFGIIGPNGDGTAFVGQAAVADAGNDYWNPIALSGNGYNGGENDVYPSFTTTALANSSNTATPVTLSIGPPSGTYFHFNQSAFGSPDPNWASGYGSLLGDYLDAGGGTGTVSINNLTPGAAFNLYLYGTSSGPGGSTFTVGGNSLATLSPDAAHSLTSGADYVVFPGVIADTNGKIVIDYSGKFAGFQLQNATTGNPYTNWINGPAFNSPTPLTASQKLPSADPDGDGITNLLEFSLGGNPTISSQSVLPTVVVDSENIVLNFKRSDDSESSTTLHVEISTDLTDWYSISPIVIGPESAGAVTVDENLADTDDITVLIERDGSSKKFVRVMGTSNP